MTALNILSGGAAQGLVASLAPQFKAQTGLDIAGEFGAVGAMADKLRSGTQADIIILTAAIVARLAEENWVVPASIADIGLVETAVAVRAGDSMVRSMMRQRCAMRCSRRTRSSFPIPRRLPPESTWRRSCSSSASPARWRPGSESFRTARPRCAIWLRSDAVRPIGCTQSTEIISTKGVMLSGSLPRGCDLSTMYTAAVATRAAHAPQAQGLIDLLIGADQRECEHAPAFLTRRKLAARYFKQNTNTLEEAPWREN